VRRLGETALAAGREARAGQVGRGRDLSRPALRWLVDRGVGLKGGRIMIVGAGTLGARLAEAAHARGARVLVASRDAGHAAAVAQRHGGEALDLAQAAALAAGMDGIAVALGGTWRDLRGAAGLPPVIDLSAPPAVPFEVRRLMGDRFGDVDQLYSVRSVAASPDDGPAPTAGPQPDAYIARAEGVVDAWAARYERWLCGRGAVPTLCSLRDRSEERRRVAVARLLRRLPELDEREQRLITTFSRQLTAALLHEPSARLREDEDGSAALAARTLFDLPR
jgi:glutamyl-tRNA reductase